MYWARRMHSDASTTGSTSDKADNLVSGKLFLYEGEGAGGPFTLSLREDGGFQYYEGYLTDHLGEGSWNLNNGILTISENLGAGATSRVNRFRVWGDRLIYLEDQSDNFPTVQLENGAEFFDCTDETGE